MFWYNEFLTSLIQTIINVACSAAVTPNWSIYIHSCSSVTYSLCCNCVFLKLRSSVLPLLLKPFQRLLIVLNIGLHGLTCKVPFKLKLTLVFFFPLQRHWPFYWQASSSPDFVMLFLSSLRMPIYPLELSNVVTSPGMHFLISLTRLKTSILTLCAATWQFLPILII